VDINNLRKLGGREELGKTIFLGKSVVVRRIDQVRLTGKVPGSYINSVSIPHGAERSGNRSA